MFTQDELPLNHSWLMHIMKDLDYPVTYSGICFGISNMALQAILLGEIDKFNERLKFISQQIQSKANLAEIINQFREERKKNIISPEQDVYEDIFAFFEGVQFYQNSSPYYDWLESPVPRVMQNTMVASPVIMPKILKDQGGLALTAKWDAVYYKKDLEQYFDILSKLLIDKPNSALLIKNFNHTITISYDTAKKGWLIIDANHLPTRFVSSSSDMAEALLTAFVEKEQVVLATELYCIKKDEQIFREVVNDLNKNSVWEEMHTASKHKASIKNSDNAYWLGIASANGNMANVDKLLKFKKDVINKLSLKEQLSPLILAVVNQHVDIVKKLLDAGADPNLGCLNNNMTPLIQAADLNNLEIVRVIFSGKKKINVNAATLKEKFTALHGAAKAGNLDMVKLLIANNAYNNATTDQGVSPLWFAVEQKHIEVIEALLNTKNIMVDNFDNFGISPLHLAAKKGLISIVSLLLSKRAKIQHCTYDNSSVLHFGVESGKVEMVKLLLDKSADPHIINQKNITPLYLAACNGNLDIVDLLLQYKVNVNVVARGDDLTGKTALSEAARNGHLEVVKKLLTVDNINPNIQLYDGATPLHIAIFYGHTEIVRALLLSKLVNRDLTVTMTVEQLNRYKDSLPIDIKKQLDDNKKLIQVSPLNLALMLGKQEIIDLLKLPQSQLQFNLFSPGGTDPEKKEHVDKKRRLNPRNK